MKHDNTPTSGSRSELLAVLEREQPPAEATLGRPLIEPLRFAFNCCRYGLGHALNVEEDLIP